MSGSNVKRKCKRLLYASLVVTLMTNPPLIRADVVAIVSAKNSSVALTHTELSEIFLGQTNHFPNGSPVTPLDLPEGSPQRAEFYTKFLGKSLVQMKAFWAKMIFTGRGQPPKQVVDELAMRQRVSENPKAVGYIDSSFADESVRILP